jgi:hypothetical protein
MFFYVDPIKYIIIGYTPKCACTHIKRLITYLEKYIITNDKQYLHSHFKKKHKLPSNINKYNTILFIRNPYKRLVSGYLNKKNGIVHKIAPLSNTFEEFCNVLYRNRDIYRDIDIDKHFLPQTSGRFNYDVIEKSNTLNIMDIEDIDYTYISNLFNKTIPESLIEYTSNKHNYINDNTYGKLYNIDNKKLKHIHYTITDFYNNDIKQKMVLFYKNDFILFKKLGFDYLI